LELGIGTRGQKLMTVLPDGRKRFKTDLAAQTQYRRVSDTRPASDVAVAKTALCYASYG